MNNINKKNLTVEILTTEDCNNNCVYCIQKDLHKKIYLDENKLNNIFNFIELYRSYDTSINEINIMLFGGEPLLNKPVCNKVFDYCYENFYRVHLITNGLLIPDYLDKFKKLSTRKLLSLQISYDGLDIHDKYRCNTSKKVLDTISLVQRNNITDLCLKATIPLDGIENIYSCWLEHLNILHMDYIPTVDYNYNILNNENIDYYLSMFKEQLLKMAKYCIKNNIKDPCTDLLRLNGKSMCTAGYYYIAINSDLNISKCHGTSFVSNILPEHIIGNINDTDILHKINESFEKHKILHTTVNEDCINCDVTLCKKCCAENYNHSLKNNYLDKWYDKNNNNLCKLYKMISKIAKAYNYIIYKNNRK